MSLATSTRRPSLPCRSFELSEILIATNNFDESLVVGKGGFGKVYKADVTNGSSVVTAAIKRLDSMSQQGETEFWAEAEMLSKFRHHNLVSLIGICNQENEMILVYEYIPNGTLAEHLHERNTCLSWIQRLKICIGAGRGLNYLHTDTGTQSGVIHRDVKSSNILLDENWTAKISDFGLSKICPKNQPSTHVSTHIKGTYGYFDPNYYQTGMLTRKSDVYAFGVVMLEVLCRKRVLDMHLYGEDRNLATWAQDSIKEGNLKYIIDSHIQGEILSKCLKEYVRIVQTCLHDLPKYRLTMAEIVVSLERVVVWQEKFDYASQSRSTTLFGKMVKLVPFGSSSNRKGYFPLKLSYPEESQKWVRVPAARIKGPSASLKVFNFADLEKSTTNFSLDLLLSEGDCKEVFLGWVEQKTLAPSEDGVGIAVAVKRRNKRNLRGHDEWLTEVNLLGHLAHPNIIRLLGYCRDNPKQLLVYEYMVNKSLDRLLYGEDVADPLSWETRLLILMEVASGLKYLHSEDLIHRDLRSSHILLDEDYNAKLGGFAFMTYGPESEETYLSTQVMGSTLGYMAPEYALTGQLSAKCDIYSLGMVLLESLSGRKATELDQEVHSHLYLIECAYLIHRDGKNVKEIMDPRLKDDYPPQGASECLSLALICVAPNPQDRPSSEEVLQSLQQIYAQYK